jgi:hypothetical protein
MHLLSSLSNIELCGNGRVVIVRERSERFIERERSERSAFFATERLARLVFRALLCSAQQDHVFAPRGARSAPEAEKGG